MPAVVDAMDHFNAAMQAHEARMKILDPEGLLKIASDARHNAYRIMAETVFPDDSKVYDKAHTALEAKIAHLTTHTIKAELRKRYKTKPDRDAAYDRLVRLQTIANEPDLPELPPAAKLPPATKPPLKWTPAQIGVPPVSAVLIRAAL